ncbi:hypothetical protein [Chryseobacterium sp. T1]
MKYILELILSVVVIFFVWNILKRLFFNSFYKNFPQLKPNNQNNQQQSKADKKVKEKVNWDAETVDYEEIKDDKKSS